MQGYWNKVLNRRLTRRRVLVATGATTTAAVLLAACGGDDNGGGEEASSGLLHKPVDETKQARHGGAYISTQNNAFAIAPDPHRIGAHVGLAARAYSQLFRIRYGRLQNTTGEFAGDIAESWELSPDKLRLTIKLDKGAGFAPVDPVNGRVVDSEDVTYSWRRMIDSGAQLRGDLANEISPDAPIVSITAPDKNTIVIDMAEPNATIYTLLGHNGLGSLWIVPKESESFDVANRPIGTGPYYVTDLAPETRIRYKKNPNFKRATLKNNEPYIEEIDTPIIVDGASRSAQLRAGQVYETAFPSLEMVGAKRENPELLMYPVDPPSTERVYFGQNENSPFRDERLRKAYYKVIDRDAYVRAAYNADFF
jgi:ABC-type transport system substrate-binding protein